MLTETNEHVNYAATVRKLAALHPIEFDRICKDEAKKLGCKTATLEVEVKKARGDSVTDKGNGSSFTIEEPEPWPDMPDTAELLDDLADTFRRFVTLPEHGDTIAALWTLHTYVFEYGHISPILVIESPEKGCGKTTLRDTLAKLAHAPLPADGISASALFRVIEKFRPTVLLDDFDSWGKDNQELRGVLNTGYRHGGYYVRCEGEDHEPRAFVTYAPKAINLIGRLHPTLHDRAVVITMRRKLPGESVQSLHGFDGTVLRRKCTRWAQENGWWLEDAKPKLPDGLYNRAADNWQPLLILADIAGTKWLERAHNAIKAVLNAGDVDESTGIILLTDIREIFADCNHIASATLAFKLTEMEERPWPEYQNGKAITVRQIARLLKPFGVKPMQIWSNGRNERGYEQAQFEDIFTRYL